MLAKYIISAIMQIKLFILINKDHLNINNNEISIILMVIMFLLFK